MERGTPFMSSLALTARPGLALQAFPVELRQGAHHRGSGAVSKYRRIAYVRVQSQRTRLRTPGDKTALLELQDSRQRPSSTKPIDALSAGQFAS